MATSTELPGQSQGSSTGSSADPAAPDTATLHTATPDTTAASTETSAQPVAEEAPPIPARADGLELLGEIPGSGYRQAPSLVRRRDGQTLQLTPLLYAVLEAIDGERSYPEIAEQVSERIGKIAGADDVQYLAEKKLKPLGVLRGADGAVPAAPKANPLLSLKPRVVITDPDRTRRITHPFARLFAPFVVVPLVAAFVAASGWLVVKKGLASATHQAFYQPGLLLVVFALTVVSAGFHEFGHAAACRRVGATPGTMGFGLYIVWPAFYTDVTDSYRLGRRQRLWVDLGGIYFNAVFAVVAYAAWLLTRWDALLLVGGLQLLLMLRQLSPVIRADGYHILADLTGVPDLFAHIGPTLKSILPSRWRSRDNRTLKRWARVIVIAWVLVIVPSLLFALVSGAVMLPRLVATAWDSVGNQWHQLTAGASDGDVPKLLLAAVKMVAVALPVMATILMLARVVRRTGRKVWAATATSQPRRIVALVAAAGIVAALAWCWWPRSQYQPIRGTERGTITQLGSYLRAASTGTAGRSVAVPVASQRPGMIRQSALLLVPRRSAGQPARPALMLLRGQPGQSPQVVALPPATAPNAPGTTPASPAPGPGAPGAGPGESGWPFPFPPPAAQRPGDNRAITVNTQDGSAVYDVAFAVVWVSGQDVTQRNDAIALANCSNCKTVSVAFQAVFIVGYSQVVTPVNTSLAVNYGCENCETAAIAVQLVTSLTALPDPATMAQLNTMWQQLDQLATQVPDLSVDEIYTRLHGIEAQILQILDNAGPDIVNTGDTIPAQSGTTPSAAPGASSSAAPASGGSAPATGTTPDQPANPAPAPSGSTPSGTATQAPGTTGDSSGTAPGGSPATTGSSATPAPAPAETTDTTTVGAPEPATAPPAPSADAPAG